MLSAIFQMCVLLLVTVTGYIAGKLKYLDKHARGAVSKLIVNVSMPLLIVSSVSEMDLSAVGSQIGPAFVLGVAMFFASLLAGVLCAFVCRVPASQRRPLLFCSVFSNLAFIGIAVAQSLFGAASVLYVSIFILTSNVFVFSIGVALLGSGPLGAKDVLRSCVNPPLVACIVAIALLFAGVKLPAVLDSSFEMVGRVTAPLAMMVVGAIVADSSLRVVLTRWRLYPFALLRQLAFPLLALAALHGVGIDPVLLATFITMFGMPAGAMSASMCEMHGADGTVAAQYTVISTILSFATLPVLITLA